MADVALGVGLAGLVVATVLFLTTGDDGDSTAATALQRRLRLCCLTRPIRSPSMPARSTTDSFGQAVLEAQASGLPVIVTDRGGPQENIVAGKTGLSIKGDDADSIVDALHFLIANPTAAANMGRAARQHMEERFFDGAYQRSWEMYAATPDNFNTPLSKAM